MQLLLLSRCCKCHWYVVVVVFGAVVRRTCARCCCLARVWAQLTRIFLVVQLLFACRVRTCARACARVLACVLAVAISSVSCCCCRCLARVCLVACACACSFSCLDTVVCPFYAQVLVFGAVLRVCHVLVSSRARARARSRRVLVFDVFLTSLCRCLFAVCMSRACTCSRACKCHASRRVRACACSFYAQVLVFSSFSRQN